MNTVLSLNTIAGFFTFLSPLFMAIFLLLKSRGQKIPTLWAYVCLSASIWGLGVFKFSFAQTEESFYFWWQVGYTGVIFSPPFYYHFVYTFLNLKRIYHKAILILSYCLAITFLIFNLFFKESFFGNFSNFWSMPGQFYYYNWLKNKSTIWIIFYVSFFWLLLGYSFFELIRFRNKAIGIKRSQFRYFILGSSIGWLGAELGFVPVFKINLQLYYSSLLIALYPLIMSYAIIKYRLMDIKVAITRAGLFIAIYTFVLGIPFAIAIWSKGWLIDKLGPSWWMMPLTLMAALATVGPFIYIYLQRMAEETLLREQRRYQESLKQASVGMTRIRNLRKLLDLITHIVTKTVRISYAAIYLYSEETNEYVLQVSRDKDRTPIPKLNSDNPLISWLIQKREPLIYEEIKRQMEDTKTLLINSWKRTCACLLRRWLSPVF